MIFRDQPGSYPGIPGTFVNCRVEVDEQGNVIVTPLAQLPHIQADTVAPPEQEAPPQETIVQEPAAPVSAPQFIGG